MSAITLEVNKIYQGDSLELLTQLPNGSIQLTVTSPAYFARKDYGNNPQNIENLPSYEAYIDYLAQWLKELYRVTDEDGRVCIVVDDTHTNLKEDGINKNRGTHARLILLAEQAGFIYKDLIIWAKAHSGHASGGSGLMLGSFPYPPNVPIVNWFEYILILYKPGKSRSSRVSEEQKEYSKLSKTEREWAGKSIWEINPTKGSKHPCPFPKEIAKRLIKLFSFYGDTVLDPFLGSGTTAIEARLEGRNFVGFEINPFFVGLSEKALRCIQPLPRRRYSQEALIS
jgi:DNA modification methylase